MTTDINQRRILIVDDENDLAELFKIRFERDNYGVQHCNNAESALQVARDFKPDVIILDIMMPRLSGFDAIDLFRSTPETSKATIVIFSALSQPEDIAKARKLGVEDYIVKSGAAFEEVVARIEKIALGAPATNGA